MLGWSENQRRRPFPSAERHRHDKTRASLALSRRVRPALDVLEDRVTPSTIMVTNGLDPVGRLAPGSLRWAIAKANRSQDQPSTVEITAAAGPTIALRAGELRISNNMTIENGAGRPVTILQTTPNSRVVHILPAPQSLAVTINGESAASPITLTGGNVRNGNGGGILVDNLRNNLDLQFVNVVANSVAQVTGPKTGSKGNGGGIYSKGSVTLENSNVLNNNAHGLNSASGHAGGVYTDQGIIVNASHVDGNRGRDSSGVFNVFGSVEVVNKSTVNNNRSFGQDLSQGQLGGGGISQMDGNVVVSDSQVNNNQTVGMYSGGIVILLGGVTVNDGSQIDGNFNNGPGGGIAANFGGPVVVSGGSQIDGNTAAGIGGGIVNFSTDFPIMITEGSEVSNNLVTNVEDGAATSGLAMIVTQQSIGKAFVAGGRGDPTLTAALRLFLSACNQRLGQINAGVNAMPFQGNVEIGGGIASPLGGSVMVTEGSSISNNHFTTVPYGTKPAAGIGGGIFANLGPITIDDSTISGNGATKDGGGIFSSTSLTMHDSNVTGNTASHLGGGVYYVGTFDGKADGNNNISANRPDNIYSPP
jgi:hypothetical protein